MEPDSNIPQMKRLSVADSGPFDKKDEENTAAPKYELPVSGQEQDSRTSNERCRTPRRPSSHSKPSSQQQERAYYAFFHIDIRWSEGIRQLSRRDVEGVAAQQERNAVANFKVKLTNEISKIMGEQIQCFDPRCMFNSCVRNNPHLFFFPSGNGTTYELWCKYSSCTNESVPLRLLHELYSTRIMSQIDDLPLHDEDKYCHVFISELRDTVYRLHKCRLSSDSVWRHEEKLSRLQVFPHN